MAGRPHPAGPACPSDHLHVTLAFLGHRPVAELESILAALREAAAAAGPIRLVPERYRETRSVGMLVLNDLGGQAARLAEDLQGRLEGLGVYDREARPWLAHLTVVRFRERPRLSRHPGPGLGPVRPMPLPTILCCGPVERSMSSSNRLP
jgi:2'-5' RNA ligase